MKDRPFVVANFAITADGKISTRNFSPTTFTSPADKRRLLEIRALGDALLVGKATLSADNMTMGLPAADLREARTKAGKSPCPLRILISNTGRFDPDLKLFGHAVSPIHIFSTERMSRKLRARLSEQATLHLHPGPKVDLAAMLRTMRCQLEVRRLTLEGGPLLFRAMLDAGFVDELHLTLCAQIFGGRNAPTLTGIPGNFLSRPLDAELLDFEPAGSECFLRYRIRLCRNSSVPVLSGR